MGTDERSRARGTLIAAALLAATIATAAEPPPAAPDAAPDSAPAAAPASEDRPPSDETALPKEVETVEAAEKTGFNVVPIPEIILDPNEGNTYGLMGVWLVTDDKDEITYMVAPDARYNETKGFFPSFRLFGYPTPTRRYTLQVGKSTTRDEDYEGEFAERGLLDGKAFVLAKFIYERDSTERFYGFGNDSKQSEESNYTSENLDAEVNSGYWVLPSVNVSYRMRIRRFNTQPGQVTSVPDLRELHPYVPGRESTVYWQHRLAVTYDTRDSIDMPRQGAYANAYVDGADRHVGSSTSFVAFGLEGRDFIPFRGEQRNPILAVRGLVDYVQGGTDTPFWLRSSLGGRRALRGYGGDRFIDFNRALLSAELRTRVYERRLFGVKGELELAPFFETGQVFRHIYDSPVSDLHLVGGLGFRMLVRPQIVAFVDVGYGSEGDSVFTGIDYPF